MCADGSGTACLALGMSAQSDSRDARTALKLLFLTLYKKYWWIDLNTPASPLSAPWLMPSPPSAPWHITCKTHARGALVLNPVPGAKQPRLNEHAAACDVTHTRMRALLQHQEVENPSTTHSVSLGVS